MRRAALAERNTAPARRPESPALVFAAQHRAISTGQAPPAALDADAAAGSLGRRQEAAQRRRAAAARPLSRVSARAPGSLLSR